MADPLSLVVVLASLSSATSSLYATSRSFAHVIPELDRQIAEVDVLLLVLEETTQTFVDRGALPKSVVAATERCAACYNELQGLMQDLIERERSKGKKRVKFRRTFKALATEQSRRTAYHAFRDSVLLLRDLAADAKLQTKLSEMSSGIIELMNSDRDDESVYAASEPADTNEAVSEATVSTWNPDKKHTQHSHYNPAKSKKFRSRALVHAKSNFTMDVTLVYSDSSGLKYTPVRAKMDTACDHNLISDEVVERIGIQNDQIEVLDKAIELNGLEDTSYKLERRVTLTWYLKRGMKSRVGEFLVVNDDSFDVVLGSRFWGGSGSSSAFFLQGPWRSRKERQKIEDEHHVNRNAARTAEEEQSRKDLESRLRSRLIRLPSGQPSSGQVAPISASNNNQSNTITQSHAPVVMSSNRINSNTSPASW